MEPPDVSGPQATATVAKDPNVAAAGGEKNQVTTTPQAASPMSRYPGLPSVPNPSHAGAVVGTATGSSTPQAGGPVRQVQYIVLLIMRWERVTVRVGVSLFFDIVSFVICVCFWIGLPSVCISILAM